LGSKNKLVNVQAVMKALASFKTTGLKLDQEQKPAKEIKAKKVDKKEKPKVEIKKKEVDKKKDEK